MKEKERESERDLRKEGNRERKGKIELKKESLRVRERVGERE